MKIIGLGHYSRTGKDSFANYLIEFLSPRFQVKKLPFAWKLKQIAHDLYSWDGLREPNFYDTREGEKYRDVKLPTVGKTPVEIWVALGTPAIRQQVYENTWIDYVVRGDHDVDVLIIPDVRFPNEVNALTSRDAHLIKVVRPGIKPRDTVADRALTGQDWYDDVVGLEGSLESLRMEACRLAASIIHGRSLGRADQATRDKVAELEAA